MTVTKLIIPPDMVGEAQKYAALAVRGSTGGKRLTGTAWAQHYFPTYFTRPFTKYQTEFWEWGETIRSDAYERPRIECEPRGVGKSTGGEALAVRLLAKKVKKFVVIISRTEDKALQHFSSAKAMLQSPELTKDYPHLKPRVDKIRNQITGWKADYLVTADGRMFMALTMESARGLKSELGVRPDLFLIDDIDLETDGPNVIAKNLNKLRTDIILAGDLEGTTLFIVLQNLIHRNSIVSKILDNTADILSDRVFCGPYKLLKWYDAVKVPIPGDTTGAMEWKITAGETYDDGIPLSYAESLLNKTGKRGFDRECQQEVDAIGEDVDFREWNEIYHISTWAEFKAGFHDAGAKNIVEGRIPERWEVGKGLDAGTTPGHPTACAYFARPDQRYPFSDVHLGLGEVVLPKFPGEPNETAPLVSPGRIARALTEFERAMGLQESQIKQEKMSHEASAMLNTFLIDLPPEIQQTFSKWKAAKGSGVPQMQRLMEIDYTQPHPFRRYPKGHAQEGEKVMGRPRYILLCANGQGELYMDGEGVMRVRGPIDSRGYARARYEIPLYSQYNSGQNKKDDDYVDADRGLHSTFGLQSGAKTVQEKVEDATPRALQWQVIEERREAGEDVRGAYAARMVEQANIRKELEKSCYNSSVAAARDFRSRRHR